MRTPAAAFAGLLLPHRRRPTARLCAAALLALVAACQTPAPPAPTSAPVPADPSGDRAIPHEAAVALRARFPELHVISRSLGRLKSDDVDDLAVVMAPIGEHGDYVVVLLSNAAPAPAPAPADAASAAPASAGHWHVTQQSAVLNPGCALCTASVNIVQRALFVHVIQAVGADYANVTYQFAYHDQDDKPRLVGVNVYQPEETDDPIPHSYSTSTDLLTGKKVDDVEDSEDDQPRHREVVTTVAIRPPIFFDSFSFVADALEPETRKLPAAAFEQSAPLPPATVRQLQARYPTLKEQSRASGALRDLKSGHDVAVVLAPSGVVPKGVGKAALAAAPTTPIVVVLLAQPGGGMQLAAASPPITRSCLGCDVQVLIARKVLTVQMTQTDAAGTQVRDFQFAFRPADGRGPLQLRLVGVRTESVTHTSSGDTRRYVNSANLLTGEKVDVIADIVGGKSQRADQHSHIPVHAPVLLNSFTFDPASLPAETKRDFALPAAPPAPPANAPPPPADPGAPPSTTVPLAPKN